MEDPVGAFKKIRDNFVLYVKTSCVTRCPSLERDLKALLESCEGEMGGGGPMHREPWIEPRPFYRTGPKAKDLTSGEVPGLTNVELDDFKSFIQCGLVGGYELFLHQIQMLGTVLSGGKEVVPGGRGSG